MGSSWAAIGYIVAVVLTLAWVGVPVDCDWVAVELDGFDLKSSFYSGMSEKRVPAGLHVLGLLAGVAGLILSSMSTARLPITSASVTGLDAHPGSCMGGQVMTGAVFAAGQCDRRPGHRGVHRQHVHVWRAGGGAVRGPGLACSPS